MNITTIKHGIEIYFGNYNYALFNSFVFDWESDFFAISKSGYTVEVEIKLSRSDFKADYKKTIGIGYNGTNKHKYLESANLNKPNKFYFACPKGLILPNEINKKYGLIYFEKYPSGQLIQDAKFLQKHKILEDKTYLKKLMDKFYYRNMELRLALNVRNYDLKHGQKRIDEHFF